MDSQEEDGVAKAALQPVRGPVAEAPVWNDRGCGRRPEEDRVPWRYGSDRPIRLMFLDLGTRRRARAGRPGDVPFDSVAWGCVTMRGYGAPVCDVEGAEIRARRTTPVDATRVRDRLWVQAEEDALGCDVAVSNCTCCGREGGRPRGSLDAVTSEAEPVHGVDQSLADARRLLALLSRPGRWGRAVVDDVLLRPDRCVCFADLWSGSRERARVAAKAA